MPCNKYKGKQKNLCIATKEWKNWDNVKVNLTKSKKGGKNAR